MAKYPESPRFNYSYGLDETFRNLSTDMDSGVEQRRRLWTFPKLSPSLVYKNKSKSGRDTIHAWYEAYHGSYGDDSGNLFYFFDQTLRHWTKRYMGRGTGAALTLDIPSKTTTNDATLIIYEDDVAQVATVDFNFVSGGGTEGADRATWIVGHYPAVGAMITVSLNGYIRLYAKFAADGWSEAIDTFSGANPLFNFQVKLQEVKQE